MNTLYIKLIFIISLITLPISAKADILGTSIAASGKVASAAITGETVQNLIEKARREAKALLAEAESSGNVLMTRAADELNLTADNVERMLSSQLNTVYDEIDEDKRDLLIGLASATKVATKLSDKAYTLKDTVSLDIRSILGDIPFVKESLVLQRITGLSAIAGEDRYKLRIIGSYLGLPGESHSSRIDVLIDGNLVEGVEVDPKEIHLVEISIPSASIEKYLLKDKPARIPLTLKISQTFKEPLFGFLWHVDNKKSYEANMNINLYPTYAGDVEVIARHQILGWKASQAIERDMTHSDHCSKNCKGHHGTTHEVKISVAGNSSQPQIGQKRITSAKCKRIAGTSGYSVDEGTSVSQDKSTAKCRIRFRTQSQTYRLTAKIEEYGVIEEKDTSVTAALTFDETTEVRIPKTTIETFIKGKLITGDKVDMVGSQTTNSGLVSIVRRLDNTNDKSVILSASRPDEAL
ncbi:hypothetical protein HG263_10295 [Pseudoalteromonas sp. JBTF-M23]|uniref:Uncharacterized protein n=1 Tax=Pseudoalteromonas caenipelagi TaxID=2726988 RepID=A0A849VDR0_9GAMM|nr:hypothetical protein [Pseudoalteromonas caenipelagi]NOU50920.1 hypothetical protein [Pseudoalteromonas caenipelagi]